MQYKLINDRKRPKAEIKVSMEILNENQELNYRFSYSGTALAIIQHGVKLVKDLSAILTEATITVRIASGNGERCMIVDEENIYDENFQVIAKVDEVHLFMA